MTAQTKLKAEVLHLQGNIQYFHTCLTTPELKDDAEFLRSVLRNCLKNALFMMDENDKDDNNKPSPEGE